MTDSCRGSARRLPDDDTLRMQKGEMGGSPNHPHEQRILPSVGGLKENTRKAVWRAAQSFRRPADGIKP